MKTMNQQPLKKAVALYYDQQSGEAPVVKAKGRGRLAEQIIERARERHIPIHEDPALIELLSKIELNEQIPPSLYQVVAEILSMIYQLEKRAKDNEQGKS